MTNSKAVQNSSAGNDHCLEFFNQAVAAVRQLGSDPEDLGRDEFRHMLDAQQRTDDIEDILFAFELSEAKARSPSDADFEESLPPHNPSEMESITDTRSSNSEQKSRETSIIEPKGLSLGRMGLAVILGEVSVAIALILTFAPWVLSPSATQRFDISSSTVAVATESSFLERLSAIAAQAATSDLTQGFRKRFANEDALQPPSSMLAPLDQASLARADTRIKKDETAPAKAEYIAPYSSQRSTELQADGSLHTTGPQGSLASTKKPGPAEEISNQSATVSRGGTDKQPAAMSSLSETSPSAVANNHQIEPLSSFLEGTNELAIPDALRLEEQASRPSLPNGQTMMQRDLIEQNGTAPSEITGGVVDVANPSSEELEPAPVNQIMPLPIEASSQPSGTAATPSIQSRTDQTVASQAGTGVTADKLTETAATPAPSRNIALERELRRRLLSNAATLSSGNVALEREFQRLLHSHATTLSTEGKD
jgi:hypothetical protein